MALGVAPVTLRRWRQDARFRPVHVVTDRVAESPVVVTISVAGIRVDGLTVKTAAQLVAQPR